MKKWLWLLPLLAACDSTRVYDNNHDFPKLYWPATEKPAFSFTIADTAALYNLYANLRHDNSYPFANLYFTFTLADSSNIQFRKLFTADFYDRKTGKPLGSSGIGFLYHHRVPLLTQYRFAQPGTYTVRFEHFMRTDTLRGVQAIGLRVEKAEPQQ